MKKLIVSAFISMTFFSNPIQAWDCPTVDSIIHEWSDSSSFMHYWSDTSSLKVKQNGHGFQFMKSPAKFDTEILWNSGLFVKANNFSTAKNKGLKAMQSLQLVNGGPTPIGIILCEYGTSDPDVEMYLHQVF